MAAGKLCGGEQQRRIVAVGSRGLVTFDLESQRTGRHNEGGERYLRIWDLGVDYSALQSIREISVRTFADPANAQLEIDLAGGFPVLRGDTSLLSLLGWAIPEWPRFAVRPPGN